ncbi:proprotein convertase subtilisin/kexin type 5-like, partial [Saccostrea cucullata]|uniref:proprotein convertase subtilisin/kexin type 5-like n=1 Tax=Saccostrea cuccullata TaxID=36930 RepID=UPI002ED37576
ICEAGFELQNNTCAECKIGFYKNISSANTTASIEERWNCTACGGNLTTLNRGTVYEEGCIEHCEEGLYLADNGTCVLCDIGYFKNTSSKNVTLSENLRWNCTKCPNGKTTSALGSLECVETCKKGEEYNETTKSCKKCKIGTYKNLTGSHIKCFVCPANYTTRQPGKTSLNDCKKADCKCPCDRVHPVRNYTSAELAQVIHTMKKELEVNKAKLSSELRKKISVMDNRPSARSLGAVGVAIISVVFIFLFVLDSIVLLKHLVNAIKNCFARN